MSSVAKGKGGSCIYYDSSGNVIRLALKVEEDESAIEADLIDQIWDKYDDDESGFISIL
jgi:hypothetical protein